MLGALELTQAGVRHDNFPITAMSPVLGTDLGYQNCHPPGHPRLQLAFVRFRQLTPLPLLRRPSRPARRNRNSPPNQQARRHLPIMAVSAGRSSPLCAWERSQPLPGLRFRQAWHQLPAGTGVLPPGVRGEAYRRAGFAACARAADCIAPHTRGQQLARLSAG